MLFRIFLNFHEILKELKAHNKKVQLFFLYSKIKITPRFPSATLNTYFEPYNYCVCELSGFLFSKSYILSIETIDYNNFLE